MIDVKIIRKQKQSGTGGTSSSTGGYTVKTAEEAKHATKADKATNAEQADYADRAGYTSRAAYADVAGDLSEDSPVNDRFLSKVDDDSAAGNITFKKMISVEGVAYLVDGLKVGLEKLYGIARDGIATLKSLLVKGDAKVEGDAVVLGNVTVDRVHDRNSTEADRTIVGAQGFDLYMGTDGKSHLYVDYFTARTRFFAASAEIRKVSYSGGTTLLSNAGSTIAKVAAVYDTEGTVLAYKCYALADDGTSQTMNWWHVGMMALCQTFNVKAGKTSGDLQNRYYWRLVTGTGQEVLDDGKLYDYILLSNVKTFQGNAQNVPSYSEGVLADDGKLLVWGNTIVALAVSGGMESMAAVFSRQEGRTKDDSGTEVASRIFYGYEPKEDGTEPDAPQPYDVIVQAGDQIRWQSHGNLIKMATSTEDNATDSAPSITMYHNMGAPYETGSYDADGNPVISPYQWKTVTSLQSPKEILFNADIYKLFQGTTDNIIDPVVVMHTVVPSTQCLIRNQDKATTTPTDITFTIQKRTGGKVETMTDGDIAWYATVNGGTETLIKTAASISLKQIGTPYGITALRLRAVQGGEELAVYDLPVVSNGQRGEDGTSVSIKGECAKHYANYSAIGTYGDIDTYVLVDSAADFPADKCSADSELTSAPSVACFFSAPDWDWRVTVAEAGDGWLDGNGDLWVAGANNWTNVGNIKGDKGDQGDKGDDGQSALDIVVSNTPLVFETDEKGLIPSGTTGTATVQVWQKGVNITAQMTVADQTGIENVKQYTFSGIGTDTISCTIEEVSTQTMKDGDKVSAASGVLIPYLVYEGVKYAVHIPFTVNVAKYTHTVYSTAKESVDKYTEVSKNVTEIQDTVATVQTDVKTAQDGVKTAQTAADKAKEAADDAQSTADKADKKADKANDAIADIPLKTSADLTTFQSEIQQTARNISLSVNQKAAGLRNMLVGSALRKTGEGWLYMSGGASIGSNPAERIEVTRHMDGSPAMHCRTIQTGTDNYVLSGMTWKGNSPQGNIYIEKGKQYTFSFWAKTSAPSLVSFVLEAIWQGSRTDTSRPAGYAGPENFSKGFETTNADTWERFEQTITIPEDAEYDYVEVNIFCRAKGYTEVEAYLCRPMMEEGNEYNGWTLAEQDYDYMGGNLLDNSATLIVGNNLEVQQGTLLPGGYDGDTAYVTGSIASTADDEYVDMLQWSTDTMGMEARTDYALSFMAKGEGQMTAYLYPSAEYTYAENSQGVRQEVTDGRAEFALTAEWRRSWVHWVPRANDQTGVLLRLRRPTSGTSTMYIAQPKLERGIVPTAWTERKTDLVDRATLLATGIDIVNKKITVTANTFEVRNNSGETTATVNEDGKLEVKDGIFTGKVKATEGEFTGVLKATSGTMDSITATNLDVTSGTIGGLTIDNNTLTGGDGTNGTLTINPTYLIYNNPGFGIKAIWGRIWQYALEEMASYLSIERDWPTKLVWNGQQTLNHQKNIAMYVSAQGTMHKRSRESAGPNVQYPNGNHAIFCPNGDYAGFRPCFRIITSSQTLTKLDVFVEIYGSWTYHDDGTDKDTTVDIPALTLTLPEDPEVGQMYWIQRSTTKYTYIKTSDGTQIKTPAGSGTATDGGYYVELTMANEMVWVWWNGDHWRMAWHMGVAD